MFCTHCGTQVADTDKFCPNCGAPIERPAAPEGATLSPSPDGEAASPVGSVDPDAPHDVPDVPPAATYTAPAPASTPTPAPKKKSHKALWIVLTCVALAVAVAVTLIVWRPWSRNSKPDTPISEPEPMPTAVPVADLSPEEAVRAAFEKFNEADSMHVDFVEDASMTIGVPALGYSQDMNLSVVLGCDSDKANGTSRIEGSMSAMGYEQSVLAYAETVDGKVLTYSSTDGGATWTLNGNENSTLSDPTATIDVWMKHAKDFEKTGTEQMNGFDTTVCSGKLSGEYVKDAASMTGGMFGTLDEAMLNDLDDLPITVWIDNESGRVVRMVLDMKNMMETLLEKALAESMGELPEGVEFSADVNKAEVVCDISQFNAIPPIVIPDEARGSGTAPEADGLVGTWSLYGGEDEQTQQYVDMMLGLGMDMIFVFNEDGTGSMATTFNGEEDKKEFTYTLENGEIVINGTGAPYRIEDGLLYLTADEVQLIFKRK